MFPSHYKRSPQLDGIDARLQVVPRRPIRREVLARQDRHARSRPLARAPAHVPGRLQREGRLRGGQRRPRPRRRAAAQRARTRAARLVTTRSTTTWITRGTPAMTSSRPGSRSGCATSGRISEPTAGTPSARETHRLTRGFRAGGVATATPARNSGLGACFACASASQHEGQISLRPWTTSSRAVSRSCPSVMHRHNMGARTQPRRIPTQGLRIRIRLVAALWAAFELALP